MMCALSGSSAYDDGYRAHQKVRKAHPQEFDREDYELAIRLEKLQIERVKQEKALQKEKTRTAQAEASVSSSRGRAGQRKLPNLGDWTKEDAQEAFRRAQEGDDRAGVAIGLMHEFGHAGYPINLQRAAGCFKAASESGNAEAKKFLKRVKIKIREEED